MNGDALPRIRKVVQVVLFDVLQDGVGMEHRGKCPAAVEKKVQALSLAITKPEQADVAGDELGGIKLRNGLVRQ